MSKQEKKQLDFEVVRTLTQNGILNYLQSGMIADIADAVQQSEFESMKPYKAFRTDIDSKLAEEIVFEYLTRHNMTNTIQCIVSESSRELAPKLNPSGNVENKLNVSGKDNYLHQILIDYNQNVENIFNQYHTNLINKINERLSKAGVETAVEAGIESGVEAETPSSSKRRSKGHHRHHHHSAKEDSNQIDDDGDFD